MIKKYSISELENPPIVAHLPMGVVVGEVQVASKNLSRFKQEVVDLTKLHKLRNKGSRHEMSPNQMTTQ